MCRTHGSEVRTQLSLICPSAPARPLYGAAALTEREANGGLRNTISWRVESLEGDGGPASHCLYFTAMQSTQNTSGISRKGYFFCSGIGLFSLGIFEFFGYLVFIVYLGFFPILKRKLLLYTCNGDKSQKPCSASALAHLARCSSRQIYWSQLQVIDGREIYGLPWLAKIVTQWPTGLSAGVTLGSVNLTGCSL